MTDILVQRLPKYVNQFLGTAYDQQPSLFRCGTAAGASCVDFAYPNQHDPYQIEHDEYVKLVGPDTPTDQNGVTDAKMEQFFADFHVGTIYMKDLVDQGLQSGDYSALYAEIEAQNRNEPFVIQFMSVADESLLVDATTGASLHPGLHYGHCVVRLGFSTDQGYGFYWDPAAPQACTDPVNKTYRPVKIPWQSLVSARINSCFAIMPPGVVPPPAGFSYQQGPWPVPPAPKPVFDAAKAESTLSAAIQALQAGVAAQQAAAAALGNLENDMAVLKGEV